MRIDFLFIKEIIVLNIEIMSICTPNAKASIFSEREKKEKKTSSILEVYKFTDMLAKFYHFFSDN